MAQTCGIRSRSSYSFKVGGSRHSGVASRTHSLCFHEIKAVCPLCQKKQSAEVTLSENSVLQLKEKLSPLSLLVIKCTARVQKLAPEMNRNQSQVLCPREAGP